MSLGNNTASKICSRNICGGTCRAAIRIAQNNNVTDLGEIYDMNGRQVEFPPAYLQRWARILTVSNL
jgi:hypothetical protein